MLRFLITAAIALVLPALAYFAASEPLSRIGVGWGDATAFLRGYEGGLLGTGARAEVYRLALTQDVAIWSGVASVGLLAAFFVLGRFAGSNRARNAAIFPTLMPLTTAVIALILLAQGASMATPALLDDFKSLLWSIAVGILGLGALAGGVMVAVALWRMSRPQPQQLLAHLMERGEAEPLWRFVEDVAQRAGARAPDHIVVGLEPNFFATAAEVATPDSGGALSGETLYISAPLTRLFTEAELTAVVAHELGHFAGADTEYSLRFAPVYRRIATALGALHDESGAARYLGAAPATAILIYLLDTFGRNERAISRERELEADRVGVAAAGPEPLATSLAKVAIYGALWRNVRARNVARLNDGKISRNLSRVYADSARYDVSRQMIDEVLDIVLKARLSHPTDSHPTLRERFDQIGFDPGRLTIEALASQGEAGRGLFPSLEKVEEDLTLLEHNVMIEIGVARAPQDSSERGKLVRFAYVLAASMVMADGVAKRREIGVAEAIGGRLFEDFDPVSFREIVAEIEDMPPFRRVVDLLAEPLSGQDKRVLHAYLGEIADIDAEVSAEEAALLDYVVNAWRITDPLWRRLAPFGAA